MAKKSAKVPESVSESARLPEIVLESASAPERLLVSARVPERVSIIDRHSVTFTESAIDSNRQTQKLQGFSIHGNYSLVPNESS